MSTPRLYVTDPLRTVYINFTYGDHSQVKSVTNFRLSFVSARAGFLQRLPLVKTWSVGWPVSKFLHASQFDRIKNCVWSN